MNLRHLGFLYNLLVTSVQTTILYIVKYVMMKEHRLLGNDTNGATQCVQVDITNVLFVDVDGAVAWVIEAIEQTNDCALSVRQNTTQNECGK